MLKTHVKYTTKTAGNDCAIMRCGSTEENPMQRRRKQENRGEEKTTVPRLAQDSFL